jgi:hypothetical protein
MRRLAPALALLALTAAGCDFESTTRDDGGPRDAMGPGRDGGADAGGVDPCAADTEDPASTVGCNGPPPGAPEPDTIDGTCTPDGETPPGPGTCTPTRGATPVCVPDVSVPGTGRCVYECPVSTTYVSTGGCPAGSRCFDLGGYGRCYRDCRSDEDCAADETCDSEGSCTRPPPARRDAGPPAVDGGLAPDAG